LNIVGHHNEFASVLEVVLPQKERDAFHVDQPGNLGVHRFKQIAGLCIAEISASAAALVTLPSVARSDRYAALIPLSAAGLSINAPREQRIERDSMVVIDFQPAYTIEFHPGKSYVIGFPAPLLFRRGARYDRHFSAPPAYNADLVRLLTAYIAYNLNHDVDMTAAAAEDIEKHLVELVAIILRHPEDDQLLKASSAKVALIRRLKDFIGNNARRRDLDIDIIAREFGISTSYIHKLFKYEGVTAVKFLWSIRLARIAVELRQPDCAAISVKDIAFGWGFSDASHFARAFKARYGMSPAKYRQTMLGRTR
jgi:AraC-like DNA-binding protein